MDKDGDERERERLTMVMTTCRVETAVKRGCWFGVRTRHHGGFVHDARERVRVLFVEGGHHRLGARARSERGGDDLRVLRGDLRREGGGIVH